MKGRLAGSHPNFRKYQGGWLSTLIDVGLKVGGAILGHKASKKASGQASEDRARELALEERRVELAETQDERSGQLFDQYQEQYAPREEQLLDEVFDRPISPADAEARATTDVRSSLETARQMGDRNLRRSGVNPNSGTYVGLERLRNLTGAKIEAGARTRAREGVRDQNFGRQTAIVGLGRNLPVSAAGFASQAQQGVGGAAQMAGLRSAGSQAQAYDAGAGYGQALGDVAGTLGGIVGDWWKNRKSSTGLPAPPTNEPLG